MTYPIVEQLQSAFPLEAICDALNVCRSAWYAWRANAPGQRAQRDEELRPLIRQVFQQHKRRYGARRIAKALSQMGETCDVARVARLLAEMELKALTCRRFRPRTTDSGHSLGFSPNLIPELPPLTSINQLWVHDITYIPVRDGTYLYLAIALDRYSRRIVGWSLQDHMPESLVIDTLRLAIATRQPPAGLVSHSDRGGQYAGHEYRAILSRAGMRQSMSRAANCYDNAFMESCFGTLKTELEMTIYDDPETAYKEIPEYIRYYNYERLHSSLEYLTPVAFEEQLASTARHN